MPLEHPNTWILPLLIRALAIIIVECCHVTKMCLLLISRLPNPAYESEQNDCPVSASRMAFRLSFAHV